MRRVAEAAPIGNLAHRPPVFGEGDGSDLSVVETALGNIGSLSCSEHLQPLSKYAMYAQNEQVRCAAWPSFSLYRGGAYALGAEVNNAASQVYAAEGQCFVIAPCAVVSKAMGELLCPDAGKQQMLRIGGGFARIYGPDGSPLGTNLPEDQEGLVIADIDLGMISLAKTLWRKVEDTLGTCLGGRSNGFDFYELMPG